MCLLLQLRGFFVPAMDFLPSPDELRGFVDDGSWTRGKALFRQGMVLDCAFSQKAQPGGVSVWQAQGRVQGSQRQPYQVEALLGFSPTGTLQFFEGDCSCPVGADCKHSVALALQAAEQRKPAVPARSQSKAAAQAQVLARVEQWLHGFGAALPSQAAAGAEQAVYLLYEHPARAGAQPRLELAWRMARRLKKGGWSKPRAAGYGSQHWLDANPADGEAVRLIRALGDTRYGYLQSDQGWLRGPAGALALQVCAGTGRLFMMDGQGSILGEPLRWGERRLLDWTWHCQAGIGREPWWELRAVLPQQDKGGTARLYPGQPTFYVDASAGVCGPAQAEGVKDMDLALLLAAPPLPASVFQAPPLHLLTCLAALPWPPGMKAPEHWPQATPVPCLSLVVPPLAERAFQGLVVAVLRFDYAGLSGWWPGREPLVLARHEPEGAAPRGVLLARDLALEDAALARLAALGLQDRGRGWFHQPDATVWLDWATQDWAPLREAGFTLELDPELADLVQVVDELHFSIAEAGAPADGGETGEGEGTSWFDLSLGMELGGERINVLPWLPGWLTQVEQGPDGPRLPRSLWREQDDGRWLRLPSAPLQPWLRVLLELVGGLGGDALRLSRLQALRLAASLGEGIQWSGAEQIRAMLGQLLGTGALPEVPLPAGLAAELRPYQRHGLNWLQFLRANQLGGVLADDMGLGKTLQTLAHLLREKEDGRLDRPCLVIAPVSLLGNWRAEAARFAPDLRTRVWHGAGRHDTGFAEDCDLLIAPYSLLQRDRERWLAQSWHVVVLDEAQQIKNASTQAAQVVRELRARQRLALSGTPLENHLGELWSLFHFLMPGFLGSQAQFQKLFRMPVEKSGDTDALARLRQRVTPFMLRRTKADVAAELPACVESVVRVALAGKQADLYETIRLATQQAVRQALAERGLARSQIQVLDALLKLRQACCDPRLLAGLPAAAKVKTSAKLELLMELLPQLLEEGRRVLLFSQFTSMLTLIEAELQAADLRWTKLTGQTQKREAAIERFTSGEVPLFLISLKAGGTGLNLQQADTVIHFDPWWNPAVEAQATGRAHRIGQKNQVMVYKLVAEGTIEERILALQERKAALAQGLLTGAAARKQPLFTEADVAELLRPLGG
ncbi:hypothetical protein GCM10010975_03120 [Comamonas phosphati]|nr:hypothetical protein GCM10010975_03120 [Comamonas phosphati]